MSNTPISRKPAHLRDDIQEHLDQLRRESRQRMDLGAIGGKLSIRTSLQDDPRSHEMEAEVRRLGERANALMIAQAIAAEQKRIRLALLDRLGALEARGVQRYQGHEMDAAEEGFDEAIKALREFAATLEPGTGVPDGS